MKLIRGKERVVLAELRQRKKQQRQNFFLDLELIEECWLYAMKAILRITQCDQRPIIKSHSKAIIKSSMYLKWFLRTTLKRVRLKSKKLKCNFFRPQFIYYVHWIARYIRKRHDRNCKLYETISTIFGK